MKTALVITITMILCCLAMVDMAEANTSQFIVWGSDKSPPKPELVDAGDTYQQADDFDFNKAEPVGSLGHDREAPATRSLLSWVRLLLVVTP